MTLRIARIESPDAHSVEMFRAMTAEERLRTAFEMWSSARSMLVNLFSHAHPEWDEDRLTIEVARRLSGEPNWPFTRMVDRTSTFATSVEFWP